ncbi:MAG TPA: hypothetical protein VLR26_03810 [Frankiaceae bacterium]|nr:hypothetical protein [Frankiaceae bacterium]
MAISSLPIQVAIPAAASASTALQQRTFRWVLMGIVVLAALLVAVMGRPPATAAGPPAPAPGLVGVSQPTGVSALPLH